MNKHYIKSLLIFISILFSTLANAQENLSESDIEKAQIIISEFINECDSIKKTIKDMKLREKELIDSFRSITLYDFGNLHKEKENKLISDNEYIIKQKTLENKYISKIDSLSLCINNRIKLEVLKSDSIVKMLKTKYQEKLNPFKISLEQ